jgi:hypothetical protein
MLQLFLNARAIKSEMGKEGENALVLYALRNICNIPTKRAGLTRACKKHLQQTTSVEKHRYRNTCIRLRNGSTLARESRSGAAARGLPLAPPRQQAQALG